MMKNFIIVLIFLISGNIYCSTIDTIQAKSKITDVTVFFSGAQITRHADLKVNKGKYLIFIDKLPQEINPQSIQVNGIDNCKILSVKHQLNYQNESKKDHEVLNIDNKIESQELEIKKIKNKINVFELEEKLLLDNSILRNNDEGTTISEIKEAADFYRVRLNEIRQGKLNLDTELTAANKKILELYGQLNELTAHKRKTYSQILITLDCEKEVTADLSLSYYISSSGWTPMYDFRVDDITKPLVIVYNANVYQSSGEDWNNINIKLSTNNPSLSGNKPEILTWYLERRNPYQKEPIKKGPGTLKGRVLDAETNEPIPFANVAVSQENKVIAGATTDFDGQYTIKPIQSGFYNISVSYVGYEPVQVNNVLLSPDKITFLDFELQVSVFSLEAVQIADYSVPLISKDNTTSGSTVTGQEIEKMSSRSARSIATTVGGVYSIDREIETSNYISNSLKSTVTNFEYDIEIPYSIPTDGEDYSIKIKEVSLPVDYVYYAIPKLDNDAFLTAQIKDWTQLSLLSGKTSIYYQGTFTGESFIDANHTSDTLTVSLGREKNILIKREGNKELFDKRIIGSSIKETIAWDITIKNNKDTKIKIIIEDQFPISERKSIEVERLESSNAHIDDKTGKLTWKFVIEPNEKRVFTYKYSVKYPKYVNLLIE